MNFYHFTTFKFKSDVWEICEICLARCHRFLSCWHRRYVEIRSRPFAFVGLCRHRKNSTSCDKSSRIHSRFEKLFSFSDVSVLCAPHEKIERWYTISRFQKSRHDVSSEQRKINMHKLKKKLNSRWCDALSFGWEFMLWFEISEMNFCVDAECGNSRWAKHQPLHKRYDTHFHLIEIHFSFCFQTSPRAYFNCRIHSTRLRFVPHIRFFILPVFLLCFFWYLRGCFNEIM